MNDDARPTVEGEIPRRFLHGAAVPEYCEKLRPPSPWQLVPDTVRVSYYLGTLLPQPGTETINSCCCEQDTIPSLLEVGSLAQTKGHETKAIQETMRNMPFSSQS